MSRVGTFRALVWTMLAVFAACIALAIFGVAGCSKSTPAPAATARVLTAADVRTALPGSICGDTGYSEVNSTWLRGYYDEFRAEIFRHGVVKWDDRFDCNHFASYYVALAQTKFYLAAFQSSSKAQSLAVGTFWYIRADGRGAHAIVFALTERGLLFIEPQTGAEVTLTPGERGSVFLATL